MSSISGFTPSIPTYQPVYASKIDNDKPRYNPLEENRVGDDAEVSDGKCGWKSVGDEYRAYANRNRFDRLFLPSDKKAIHDAQIHPLPHRFDQHFLPSDKKAIHDAQFHPLPHRFDQIFLPSDKKVIDDAQIHPLPRRFDHLCLPSDQKVTHDAQIHPLPHRFDHGYLPSDQKVIDDAPSVANRAPIDS
ncbi:hypothetical protein GIV23_24950 [Pseudomonas sp. PA-1-2A]|uniref:hypothetical protein n=1 Tax=Pseudomonas TaxID=286 RepID=UPI0011B1F004|nr:MULTISPECIES: hypothetical protein [Pseudomonas]MCF5691708.1 hypothetical protein [Pseudomonas sp. PA-1-8C]MCF5789779.1 hypothetical protein [Pseudomonas sp. PA-1-6G]MCF5794839.1 hypothetical protein [Pseudomonas sp. PA-1-6B]MCF5799633.1 hypothetical protein [Pseudomonas sp. PA-1-5A]MCF5816562.1 hypothetical protein [Pseudomonas sp. PA-1-2A]